MQAPIGIAALVVLASACAAPAATTIPPGHQSAAREEQSARADDRAAGVFEMQAAIDTSQPACGLQTSPSEICWTYQRGGAASLDLNRAQSERRAAAEHRRVSTALVAVELAACDGVAQEDIDRSPFAHREDIVDVQTLTGPTGMVVGARVRFHEIEKLTTGWLQHVVDCHLARDNALGHDVPEMAYCPLVPRGATATVFPLPHGYIIEVRSDDPAGAREIARRAMALRP